MILVAVSAMPAVMQKTAIGPEGSTPTRYTYSISGGPVIDADNWGRQITNDEFQSLRKIPIPRKLNTTKIRLYKLDGEPTDLIDTRLAFFNIDNIEFEYNGGSEPELAFKTDLLSDLVKQDLANNIIACWEIPDDYIDSGNKDGSQYNAFHLGYELPEEDPRYDMYSGGYGQYTSMNSKLKSDYILYTPYSGVAQTVVNNKARYGQSVTVKVYNPASGASLTKHIYDALPDTALPGTNQYVLNYRVAVDLRPDGYPIFSFVYNDGGTNQLKKPTEFIKGGSWRKVQLNVQGVPGSYFDKLALNNSRDELNTRTALGLLGSAMSFGLGVAGGSTGQITGQMVREIEHTYSGNTNKGNWTENQQIRTYDLGRRINPIGMIGGAAGIAGTVGSYIISRQKLENEEALLNARSLTAVTPAQIGQADFMKDTGMNKFYYVFTSYNEDDMYQFDTFLTRYGYNVGNMLIRNRHFYSRKNFNYIRVNDISIISNGHNNYQVSKSILEKVQTQLQQGVRIWRVKPDAHYLLPEGNNEINPIAYQ